MQESFLFNTAGVKNDPCSVCVTSFAILFTVSFAALDQDGEYLSSPTTSYQPPLLAFQLCSRHPVCKIWKHFKQMFLKVKCKIKSKNIPLMALLKSWQSLGHSLAISLKILKYYDKIPGGLNTEYSQSGFLGKSISHHLRFAPKESWHF